MSEGTAADEYDELEELWTELATIATETARLLVQPENDGAEVEVRAAAVRKCIKEVQAQRRGPEPPELLFHHPHGVGSRLLSGS